MIAKEDIQKQLANIIESVDVAGCGEKIEGKVRDCYVFGDKRALIASDRLSAFDVVLTTIPFKGEILNRIAMHWFKKTEHIVQNHIISHPHPNVMIAREVKIIPVEVVVRGYIAGSAWRDYVAGNTISGVTLPEGMKKSQKFETPLVTPSTKAERGTHDEPISEAKILEKGIVEESLWNQVRETALKLFACGTEKAAEQSLILVDTKYEFGTLPDGTLVLADEMHTPDSSRYWLSNSYQQRFDAGEDPEMLDKEYVRRQLIAQGYMGDGTPPDFSEEFRVEISQKYIEVFEQITGEVFTLDDNPGKDAISQAVKEGLA